MEKRNTFPLVLILLMALILGNMSSITYAQDYTQFNLEGAKRRLGKGRINDIAYSQDGTRLAVATSAGIWIYDAHTGAELDILLGHTASVARVVYAPDGTTLASGSVDGAVRLWDVDTGEFLRTLTARVGSIASLAFSPDGTTLACGGHNHVQLLDTVSGVSKVSFKASTHMVDTVAFSPDGTTLASGSWNPQIQLWDVISGQPKAILTGHTGAVRSVAFSPDGSTLVSTSRDGTIRLWEAVTGVPKGILAKNRTHCERVAFSPDGSTIAAGSHRRLYLLDAVSGQSKVDPYAAMDTINSLAFSPDGTTLAGSDGAEVRLWDPISGEQKTTLVRHTGRVNSVAFSPDGTTLASGNSDATIRLWDAVNGQLKATLIGHTDIVESVAFSPDGSTLASGSSDRMIFFWDVVNGQLKAVLTGHTDVVESVAFSPDGSTLASGGRSGTILLWDVASGKPKAASMEHTAGVWSVAFSPDGSTLASAGGSTIRFWDVASGKPKAAPIEHDEVSSVAFSPDGRTLASGGEEQVKLWDAATGAYKAGQKGTSKDVVFSPDGSTLATATLWAEDVQLLDAATGALKTIFGSSSFDFRSFAFSPDSRTLAASTSDGFIILWELAPSLLQPQAPTAVILQPQPDLPSMVRLIYVFSSDATPHPNIETRLDSLIKETQQFYAEQMEKHGFGRKTFSFEKDANGNAVVHHLKSLRPAARYTGGGRDLRAELESQLDMAQHFYLVVLDASFEGILGEDACGVAFPEHRGTGGIDTFEMDNRLAMIYAFGECHSVGVAAHELGHLFGLKHDYRDYRYVMNHGALIPQLSYWAAEWLDVHPALNPSQPESDNITTIDVLSSRSNRLQFQVADADGIHQAQLIITESKPLSFCNGSSMLHGCQPLNGGADITFELTATEASIEATLQVIDMHGTITGRRFFIELDVVTLVGDVNKDGIVNVLDLTLVASNFGKRGRNDADVNKDGIVNIIDLTLVAAALGNTAAAPGVSAPHLAAHMPTRAEVAAWLRHARAVQRTDLTFQRGLRSLEQLLSALTPQETAILPNYPNPFNPETWIPYRLADPAHVSISIYTAHGRLVKTLKLGYQAAGIYESRKHAAYWDGKNQFGEPVASGVYFYTLSADAFRATRKMLIRK